MENNNLFVNRVLTKIYKRVIDITLGKRIINIKEPPRPQGGTRSLKTGASLFLRKYF